MLVGLTNGRVSLEPTYEGLKLPDAAAVVRGELDRLEPTYEGLKQFFVACWHSIYLLFGAYL